MKRTERRRQFGSIHRLTARGGFTLVEVLVVMAIMVILFGMLFVPISTSLDMARAGQARTQMQQHLQMAMQRVNRGLATARYIYLPEYIPIENTPGDLSDDTYLINYSNVTFQPSGDPDQPAVRYAVMTPAWDPGINIKAIGGYHYYVPQPPDTDNPWILYRMEGRMAPVGGRNLFGADYDVDGDGTDEFVIGLWSSRNALTPARNADIPVTRTICLDANGYLVLPPSPPAELGQLWAKGYVARGDLDDNGTSDIEDVFDPDDPVDEVMLVYIHDGVKFGPLRVENERLADAGSGDTTSFSAEYGHWLGLPNPLYRCSACGQPLLYFPPAGACPICGGAVMTSELEVGEIMWQALRPDGGAGVLLRSSELRPRIVVRRDGTAWVMDTDALDPTVGPPPVSVDGGTVIDNIYGTSWNSGQGTVTLASVAGPATIDFSQGTYNFASPPPADEVWDFVATDVSGSGDTVQFVLGSDVYDENIRHTTLTAPPVFPYTSIEVADATQFDEGDDIRIVDADNITNWDDVTIDDPGGISGNTITFAPALTNSYAAGDWVREITSDPNIHYRRAYSSYGLVPYVEPAVDPLADKMVVPDSVRVTVNAWSDNDSDDVIDPGELASKEYRRVLFADPSTPAATELANLGYGEFGIQRVAPGDYRWIIVHFANGELGTDGQFVPPPSPDDPSTFGGTSTGWDVDAGELTAFWIEISYNVRRNFSTATLRNDQIDVSYSTRAVYNVSLELLPWRYYEDNDTDHIWTPYQHIKGVHLQAQIPIAALGG